MSVGGRRPCFGHMEPGELLRYHPAPAREDVWAVELSLDRIAKCSAHFRDFMYKLKVSAKCVTAPPHGTVHASELLQCVKTTSIKYARRAYLALMAGHSRRRWGGRILSEMMVCEAGFLVRSSMLTCGQFTGRPALSAHEAKYLTLDGATSGKRHRVRHCVRVVKERD
jgi:hypothetical protein